MKQGPKAQLPPDFFEILAVHVSMKQLEGVNEEKPRTLKALIGAALMNTKFEHFSTDYVYRKFRSKYPDVVEPTKIMQMEERRGLWGTFKNLNTWFDGSKKCLIQYGYAVDKPMRVVDLFRGWALPIKDLDGEHFHFC